MRAPAAALVVLLVLPGCLGGGDPAAVRVEGPGPVLSTGGDSLVLRGTVEPAASEVRLLDGATLQQSAVARRRGAAFALRVEHLPPGPSSFVVEASHRGLRPWRRPVRVVSRAPRAELPRRVTVPAGDPSPAEALLRLDRRRLVAVATGRDPGGMARIRVSAELRLRCRDRATGAAVEVGLVRHDPPSQIEHARIVPGTRVPAELRRRSDLRAAAAARCAREGAELRRVAGRVWAEATNAHGRDRYSAYVPVADG